MSTGYRGLFADKINPRVKAFLDKEQKLYKDKDPSVFQKTPWVRLTSNATDVYVNKEKIDSDNWRLQLEGSGVLLSGWSDTTNGFLYSSTRRNLPKPGITGVNVKTRGKLGSILNATINIQIPYEGDLEYIEKLYMVPGVTCLLEWGWSDYSGNYLEIQDGDTIDSVKKRGIAKTLGFDEDELFGESTDVDDFNSVGKCGSMVGVIYKFSYEAAQNGGYTATVELLSESYFTVGRPISTNILPDVIVPKPIIWKAIDDPVSIEDIRERSFGTTTEERIRALETLDPNKAKPGLGGVTEAELQAYDEKVELDRSGSPRGQEADIPNRQVSIGMEDF